MRGIISLVFLLTAYVLVLVPDAVRLPALVSHYVEHKDQAPELDLSTFLYLHYGNKEHSENGDAPHERLPFHHHHVAGDNCPSVTITQASATMPQLPIATLTGHAETTADELLPGHSNGLIRPPRA